MKILFDITHPKDVHLFKNLIWELQKNTHEVFIVARNRIPIPELLNFYKMNYTDRGKGGTNVLAKLFYLFKGVFIVFKSAVKFKPDLLISAMSPYVPIASFLLGKPSLLWDDTEHAVIHKYFTYPFCSKIFTPYCYRKNINKKHQRFNSILELAYLHPNRFKPNPKIVEDSGINPYEKYVVIRFVAWTAHHDIGHMGISLENKLKAVDAFSKYAKVYITSESDLPDQLKKYNINVSSENIHHVLAFASLFFGESATMAAESSVLGVPSIFIDNNGRGYTDELEKFKLLGNYTETYEDQISAIEKGTEILKEDNRQFYQNQLNKFLAKNVDLTDEMLKEALKFQN